MTRHFKERIASHDAHRNLAASEFALEVVEGALERQRRVLDIEAALKRPRQCRRDARKCGVTFAGKPFECVPEKDLRLSGLAAVEQREARVAERQHKGRR